jgi:hypothetical protein
MAAEISLTSRGQTEPRRRLGVWSFSNRWLIPFLVVFLIAALLRIYRLNSSELWLDERTTLAVMNRHMADVLDMPVGKVIDPSPDFTHLRDAGPWTRIFAPYELQPPLYPILLRVWLDVVGERDWRGRLLSVFFSLAALALLFDAASVMAGPRVGWTAACLMAVAGPQIYYGQELRDYAMCEAMGMAAFSALARFYVGGRTTGRLWGLGLAIIGMAVTHFFSAGAIAALALFALLWMRGAGRAVVIASAVLAAVAAGAYVLGERITQADYMSDQHIGWLHEAGPGHVARTFLRLATLPSRFVYEPAAPPPATGSATTTADARSSLSLGQTTTSPPPPTSDPLESAVYAWVAGAVIYLIPLALTRRRPLFWLAFLWIGGVVGSVAATDLLRSTAALYWIRYTLLAAPMVYLSVAALCDVMRPRALGPVVLVVAIVGCLMALPRAYDREIYGDWRGLGRDIREHVHAGDVLVICGKSNLAFYAPNWVYLAASHFAGTIPCPTLLLDGPADAEQLAALRTFTNVWVITGWFEQPRDFLPEYRAGEVMPVHFNAGMLFRMVPAAAAVPPQRVGGGK